MEIIDRLSAGDPEKKRYYINLFLEVLIPEVDRMRSTEMREAENQEPLRQILHKLKSQVQTIGAQEIHALMHTAEAEISSGSRISGDALSAIVSGLQSLIESLQEKL